MLPTEPPASLSEESAKTQRFAKASSAPAPSEASAEARLGALVDVPERPAGTTPVTDAVLPTEPLAPLSEESAEGKGSLRRRLTSAWPRLRPPRRPPQ